MSQLFLMCGVPGCGKSTWAQKKVNEIWSKSTSTHVALVSRDAIRFTLIRSDEDYFSKENQVFKLFTTKIKAELAYPDSIVFADATHLNEKSRKKLLDKIKPDDSVKIVPVYFDVRPDTCHKRNEARTGMARVPDKVVFDMEQSFRRPNFHEAYDYAFIIKVHENGHEEILRNE